MELEFYAAADHPGPLKDDKVHLWTAPLDRPCAESPLTEQEIMRAQRFKMEHVRRQFVCTRAHLRIILGRYLSLEPRAVPLSFEPSGKPMLDPALGSDLQFNVSHSDSLAVYSVTRTRRTGVDVEMRRVIPNTEGLVERFFTRRERDLFFAMHVPDRLAAFYCAWTRKEAVLKAIGRGVQALDQCDVAFGLGEPEAVLRLFDDDDPAPKWFLRSWEPRPNYSAAVAVQIGNG